MSFSPGGRRDFDFKLGWVPPYLGSRLPTSGDHGHCRKVMRVPSYTQAFHVMFFPLEL